ncbi:MAG: GDP-mannose 4,6-dehydratase [Actinomycetota bacterium]|nr:GDP-mannose 4,6-dehydratase [Actinomycetota bacterium]
MRVLITGATGFVGRHLVAECATAGNDVTGTAREEDAPDWLEHYAQIDITGGDLESLVARVKPEVVYHLAAQSSVGRSWDDPIGTLQTNVIGTARLLAAIEAAAPDASVVVVGSADVYGAQDGSPIREDAVVRPQSPYAASKAACEALAASWAHGRGVRVVATRSFSQLGPGQRSGFALADWASAVARAVKEGGGVVEAGDIDVVRDYIHVRDAARAYRVIAEGGEPGGVVNVCSGSGSRLGDLLDRLIKLAGVDVEIRRTHHRPADIRHLVGDNSRLSALGWEPVHTIEEGLQEMLDEHR